MEGLLTVQGEVVEVSKFISKGYCLYCGLGSIKCVINTNTLSFLFSVPRQNIPYEDAVPVTSGVRAGRL